MLNRSAVELQVGHIQEDDNWFSSTHYATELPQSRTKYI